MANRERYFNRHQEGHMAALGRIPRDQRCASGWHVTARQTCDCDQRHTPPAAPDQQQPGDAAPGGAE
jgi:hypothetical protein